MNKRTASVNKYNKENTRAYLIRLNKNTDQDIIAWLQEKDNKQGYIKELIRMDMQYFEK